MAKTIEEQIILHEGLRLDVYKCSAGKLTIGVGRNLEDVGLYPHEQKMLWGTDGIPKSEIILRLRANGITKKAALAMLDTDITKAKADIENFRWFAKLNEVRKKVVIDMRFNLGPSRFRGFQKMIAAIDAGDYTKAAEEMIDSKWFSEVKTRAKRLALMMMTGKDYDDPEIERRLKEWA